MATKTLKDMRATFISLSHDSNSRYMYDMQKVNLDTGMKLVRNQVNYYKLKPTIDMTSFCRNMQWNAML